MTFKKKKIGELNGIPIVTGKRNYATENEYYVTLKDDNTYQKLEQRTDGDQFKVIFLGNTIYIGKFYIEDLPTLNGFDDYGKVAYVKDTDKTAYWDGYGWTYVGGSVVTPRYLTFTANQDGVELAFFFNRSNAGEEQENPNITFQKSTDGGLTWKEHTIGVYDPDEGDTSDLDIITLDEGESVIFKGVNSENFTVGDPKNDEGIYVGFYLDGGAAASGDITSLINGVGGDAIIQSIQFYKMFQDCTCLTSAPELPATTLANDCYNNMFGGCTGLTSAPTLPATILADYCYDNMFGGCTGLTQVPDLPAITLADYCYQYMFNGCQNLTSAPVLPATKLANSCYSYMFYDCTSLTLAPALPSITLEKSCYKSMFQNCTSLIKAPALPATTLANGCYSSMFQNCTSLIKAPALPAITLTQNCYSNMFYNCTSLIQAPALPATTLASGCYSSMFNKCTALTQAPELPATTLADYCYNKMFNTCSKLEKAPNLPATTLANSCYDSMFSSCVRLTQAPALPATTLANNCYSQMFSGCVSLKSAPALPATMLGYACYSYMFQGCTAITSHDVATLNNSSLNTFQNNQFCASLTIHAATPPTIANSTITGLKANCIIYVPSASVDAYKAKQYWSARASYIQAIPSGN